MIFKLNGIVMPPPGEEFLGTQWCQRKLDEFAPGAREHILNAIDHAPGFEPSDHINYLPDHNAAAFMINSMKELDWAGYSIAKLIPGGKWAYDHIPNSIHIGNKLTDYLLEIL
jgi:hypothetical protein